MVSERERLVGIRLFIAMSILFLVGALGVNLYQAHQSGTGYGWGDTREPHYTDQQHLIALDHTPTSERIPGARGFVNEAVRIVVWLALMALVLVFWHTMLSRLGTF